MTTGTLDDADYDPGADALLHDAHGNLIDSDYIDKVNREAEIGYDLNDLAPARVRRPPLSKSETPCKSDSASP